MLNQTKTYYCVQEKYHSDDKKQYILYSTRQLARDAKKKMIGIDLTVVKVNVAIHWK